MLTLQTPYDTQLALRDYLRQVRKQRKLSIRVLSESSGIPVATLRKFEETGNISLRQFLMLYHALGNLDDIHQLTKKKATPQSIEEVLKNA